MILSNLFYSAENDIPPGYSFVVEGSKNADPLKVINFVVILFLIIIVCLTVYTIFLHHKINKLVREKQAK